MRFIRSLLALAALGLGAAACEPDRGIIPEQITGVWTDSLSMSEGITWAHTLDLRPDGEFYWDQITYGGQGYGHDVPVYRTVLHGRYTLAPGALNVRVEDVEYSGAALGRTVREPVENPRWSGDFYRARFFGDELELSYTTAPFDTPVEYRFSFTRQPPGQPID